nr:plasmid mobilization relaxosome protein MobC [Actinomadura rayongensis]
MSELAAVKRLALAIGNNVNQLARAANATGQQPRELPAVLEAAARVLARAESAVAALDGSRR